MMATNEQIAAALCEQVYRRNDTNMPISDAQLRAAFGIKNENFIPIPNPVVGEAGKRCLVPGFARWPRSGPFG
jgi:hypothetical protein